MHKQSLLSHLSLIITDIQLEKKKWSHNITVAQFLHLPVDLIGTVAVEHKARAVQHINLKVGALFEGDGLGVVSALAALVLILALQQNVTHHNLHALLALGLGIGTLNLKSAEIQKLIFFSL